MKWIKSYTKFKSDSILESVVFSENTYKTIINTQFSKSLESLPDDCKPEDIIKWLKEGLLSTKSELFLLRPAIEELKASGGKGGSFLKPGYYNQPSRKADNIPLEDCEDLPHYSFMEGIFSKGGGLFADPNEFFDKKEECGLIYVKPLMSKKFGSNRIPYEVVKYIMKSVRQSVARKLKIPDKNLINFSDSSKGGPGLMRDSFTTYNHKSPDTYKGLWRGFFKDESATPYIPELKKLLISCGGRDLFKPEMVNPKDIKTPGGQMSVEYEYLPTWKSDYEPIIKKKRSAFYNWFTTKVYGLVSSAVSDIDSGKVKKHLESLKITSVPKYDVGTKVVYLRKDKNIEDWNKLSDVEKESLDKKPTSEIVGRGTVTEVKGDEIKIEYSPDKFATKKMSEIIEVEETKKDDKETESQNLDSEKDVEVQKPDSEKEAEVKEPDSEKEQK